MPKIYIRKARKDIYEQGLKEKINNKKGYTLTRTKPKNSNDRIIIKKGESYFTWHPKGQDWQFSREFPDLRSFWEKQYEEYETRVQAVVEAIEDDTYDEGDVEDKEELSSEIDQYLEELQSNLDNIPEQLQESSVLNERIEQLQELINQLS